MVIRIQDSAFHYTATMGIVKQVTLQVVNIRVFFAELYLFGLILLVEETFVDLLHRLVDGMYLRRFFPSRFHKICAQFHSLCRASSSRFVIAKQEMYAICSTFAFHSPMCA